MTPRHTRTGNSLVDAIRAEADDLWGPKIDAAFARLEKAWNSRGNPRHIDVVAAREVFELLVKHQAIWVRAELAELVDRLRDAREVRSTVH
jgi:hypothetical protein